MEYDNKFYETLSLRCREWQENVGACIIKHYGFKSVIDLGCGSGYYLNGMFREGAKVKGYEYSYAACKPFIPSEIAEYISYADLGEKLNDSLYDLAMSIEVAEHLPENKSDIFVDNICGLSNTILFSASRGGNGKYEWGHLNPQKKKYWIKKFTNRNYIYSGEDSKIIGNMFLTQRGSKAYRVYLRDNVMVFKKLEEK